ncbi:MAG: hypothetical protein QM775_00875 [Pirellulales bacterium]
MTTLLKVLFAAPLVALSVCGISLAIITVRQMRDDRLLRRPWPLGFRGIPLRREESPMRFWLIGCTRIVFCAYVSALTAYLAVELVTRNADQ